VFYEALLRPSRQRCTISTVSTSLKGVCDRGARASGPDTLRFGPMKPWACRIPARGACRTPSCSAPGQLAGSLHCLVRGSRRSSRGRTRRRVLRCIPARTRRSSRGEARHGAPQHLYCQRADGAAGNLATHTRPGTVVCRGSPASKATSSRIVDQRCSPGRRPAAGMARRGRPRLARWRTMCRHRDVSGTSRATSHLASMAAPGTPVRNKAHANFGLPRRALGRPGRRGDIPGLCEAASIVVAPGLQTRGVRYTGSVIVSHFRAFLDFLRLKSRGLRRTRSARTTATSAVSGISGPFTTGKPNAGQRPETAT